MLRRTAGTPSEPRALPISGCQIPLSSGALDHYRRELRLADNSAALDALALALSVSKTWRAWQQPSVLVRHEPEPHLAVVGRFTRVELEQVALRARAVGSSCLRLRWIDESEARLACEQLAAKLRSVLTPSELETARFTAIPQGGLVVLAMLADAMKLDPSQLRVEDDQDRLTIVVDDCAFSGRRFFEFLHAGPQSGRIVFAPVYTTEILRSRIVARERTVTACLSAEDIASQEPACADALSPWLDGAYCFANTVPIAFPWNEPDRSIWDPFRERPLSTWPIVPPDRCVKNQPRSADISVPVLFTASTPGPVGPADTVLYGELDAGIVLLDLATDQVALLDDVASESWRALVRAGSVAGAASELASAYEVDVVTLDRDLRQLVEQLQSSGFLVRAGVGGDRDQSSELRRSDPRRSELGQDAEPRGYAS